MFGSGIILDESGKERNLNVRCDAASAGAEADRHASDKRVFGLWVGGVGVAHGGSTTETAQRENIWSLRRTSKIWTK